MRFRKHRAQTRLLHRNARVIRNEVFWFHTCDLALRAEAKFLLSKQDKLPEAHFGGAVWVTAAVMHVMLGFLKLEDNGGVVCYEQDEVK